MELNKTNHRYQEQGRELEACKSQNREMKCQMERAEVMMGRVEMIGNEYEVMKTQLKHVRAKRNTYAHRL